MLHQWTFSPLTQLRDVSHRHPTVPRRCRLPHDQRHPSFSVRFSAAQHRLRYKPRPHDLSRLRKEIGRLNSKVDNAEDAVLDAPPSVRPGIYRKLEDLTEERRRLISELETLSRHTASEQDSQAEIDQAMDVLRNLVPAD